MQITDVESLVEYIFDIKQRKPYKQIDSLIKKTSLINDKLIELDKQKEDMLIKAGQQYSKLIESGLSSETVMKALIAQYGKNIIKTKPKKRTSHKVKANVQEQIVNYINENKDGVSFIQISKQFSSLNKRTLQILLKKMIKDNVLKASGKTRSLKYALNA